MTLIIFPAPREFEDFIEKCEKTLLNGPMYTFQFPENYSGCSESIKKIYSLNENFLSSLRGKGNVYAIFIREASSLSWQKKYVGQSKSHLFRGRVREHLIKKDYRTGSVLAKIMNEISLKKEVGVAFIRVEPEALRRAVEEVIIIKHKPELEWNKHG